MIKAIFMDMDDTLIVNKILYDHASAMLCGYLQHCGVPLDAAQEKKEAIDRELYKVHGYLRTRYPQTFENTLKHFVPDASPQMVATVRTLAETVFKTVAPVKPGVIAAIDMLAAHYPLYVVTQGDNSVQSFRISHLPFLDKLTETFIVDKKETATFTTLAQNLGYAPDEVVMVGDSLKSDIVPALEAGLHAIWIEADNWSIEAMKGMPKSERLYERETFMEAARFLVALKTQKAAPNLNPR